MSPFRPALDLLDTIPGVNQAVAEAIVAEAGGDMGRFRSAQHLASWAGLCPGHHESAGRVRGTRVRTGNPSLKGALGMAAFGAARTKGSFLQTRYKRLTSRRGPIRALSPSSTRSSSRSGTCSARTCPTTSSAATTAPGGTPNDPHAAPYPD